MNNSIFLYFLLVAGILSLPGCMSNPTPISASTLPVETSPPAAIKPTPTAVPTLDTITGSLRNQINTLEDNMPREDSGGYVLPTEQEQEDFSKLIAMLESDDLSSAADLASGNNYNLTYFVDRGDNRALDYLLREDKPVEKGWGLYAFRVDSKSNIIVEAPHPLSDIRTPSVALDIYRALDARALLIAGAHRNANSDGSADVAHATESIFQSVHLALSQGIQTASEETIVLQIHGFHSTKHEGYPQVILGFGEETQTAETTLAQKIKEALADHGITTGICTGGDLQDLCAKTNIQASAPYEGIFIHIELDENIRRHDDALITALLKVFGD